MSIDSSRFRLELRRHSVDFGVCHDNRCTRRASTSSDPSSGEGIKTASHANLPLRVVPDTLSPSCSFSSADVPASVTYYIRNPKRKLKLGFQGKENLELEPGVLDHALKRHLITISKVREEKACHAAAVAPDGQRADVIRPLRCWLVHPSGSGPRLHALRQDVRQQQCSRTKEGGGRSCRGHVHEQTLQCGLYRHDRRKHACCAALCTGDSGCFLFSIRLPPCTHALLGYLYREKVDESQDLGHGQWALPHQNPPNG